MNFCIDIVFIRLLDSDKRWLTITWFTNERFYWRYQDSLSKNRKLSSYSAILSRLFPNDVSVRLLSYLHIRYAGRFNCGKNQNTIAKRNWRGKEDVTNYIMIANKQFGWRMVCTYKLDVLFLIRCMKFIRCLNWVLISIHQQNNMLQQLNQLKTIK